MHIGLPNTHSVINKNTSGQIVLDPNDKHVFPALNVSNNFATIDYDAHYNTEKDYITNLVFRSTTVQELNIIHTVCI